MVSMTAADSSDFGAGAVVWAARRALSTLIRSGEGALPAAAWVSCGGWDGDAPVAVSVAVSDLSLGILGIDTWPYLYL